MTPSFSQNDPQTVHQTPTPKITIFRCNPGEAIYTRTHAHTHTPTKQKSTGQSKDNKENENASSSESECRVFDKLRERK